MTEFYEDVSIYPGANSWAVFWCRPTPSVDMSVDRMLPILTNFTPLGYNCGAHDSYSKSNNQFITSRDNRLGG
ncbi:hypothetical protein CVT26_012186 [Gymnopilus dilepis]|uniref:Uncharacterized protein n=1 Tax=Gymnopilus dilepis TaxID=231916 RepID=A0A409W5S4_9AGAR|nr:hypothetical protein CVT26_012186 [Gymnopilus dilepis]